MVEEGARKIRGRLCSVQRAARLCEAERPITETCRADATRRMMELINLPRFPLRSGPPAGGRRWESPEGSAGLWWW